MQRCVRVMLGEEGKVKRSVCVCVGSQDGRALGHRIQDLCGPCYPRKAVPHERGPDVRLTLPPFAVRRLALASDASIAAFATATPHLATAHHAAQLSHHRRESVAELRRRHSCHYDPPHPVLGTTDLRLHTTTKAPGSGNCKTKETHHVLRSSAGHAGQC